ncbi:MAG: alpha/beta fold hydrolase [Acidimicrobiales bacterium]
MATVVLVHGLFGAFGDRRMWRRLDSHRVVVPDLLGYGEHAATSEKITIEAQVEHVRALLDDEPVHMVGHSVGGVLTSLYAHQHPDDVLGLVNVEGNFTLADAFWSAELARKPAAEAAALLEHDRADPAAWFDGTTNPYEIDSARAMLAFQPASTLQAMAASVVAITGAPTWEPLLREVFARTPVHLLAGETSRAAWNVPDWALQAARSYTQLPGVGHTMMFQQPEAFGDAVASLVEA